MPSKRIIIIGAGPSGLGAAYRLNQLGHDDFLVYEKNGYAGGLCASFRDKLGFIWDTGGHVISFHHGKVNRLLDDVMGDNWIEHARESWVHADNTWVPYPFQNNLRYLSKPVLWECVRGFINRGPVSGATNFKDWIVASFGDAMARHFMIPYNQKSWAYPLEKMSAGPVSRRISQVSLEKMLRSICLEEDDVEWGPHVRFRFPSDGGTGVIFRKLGERLQGKLILNKEVVRIDPGLKKIYFKDGGGEHYDYLINTSPLNTFAGKLIRGNMFGAIGRALPYNGVWVLGIGVKKKKKDKKNWMYFPGGDVAFYRVTHFSNYSPNNVPSQAYQSFLCEISFFGSDKPDKKNAVESAIAGLIRTGLLEKKDRKNIVSRFAMEIPCAYPIPTLERDAVLQMILPELEKKHIFSCGRFGQWKYEEGDMGHSILQGMEAAEKIVQKTR